LSLFTDEERGLSVHHVRAEEKGQLHGDTKSMPLPGNALMAPHAAERNVFETILIPDGFVTAGSTSNVSMAKNDQRIAPPCNDKILEGIRPGLIEALATKRESISPHARSTRRSCATPMKSS